MSERNIKLTDLARGIDLDQMGLKNPVVVPNEAFRELLDQVIERGALESVSSRTHFYVSDKELPPIT